MAATRSWTIGADPSCDLVVSQDFVSGRHCRLIETGSGYVLEDLGSTNGTFINGTRLAGSRAVSRQDRITLGATTPFPWPSIPVASPPSAPIAATNGQRIITIGRGPENDVVLDYATVSTRHARLIVDGGAVTIEDLNSTNGTFLGGLDRRITRAPLSPADTVYFGTQAIPASRLLAGISLPAGPVATVAVDARMLAAVVGPQSAPPPTQVRPAIPLGTTPSRAAAPPSLQPSTGISPALLGGVIAAAVVLIGAVVLFAMRGRTPESSQPSVEAGSSVPGGGPVETPDPDAKNPKTAVAKGDVRNAVYAVLIDSRGDEQRRVLGNIGSAAAVKDRRLLTSGGIVTEVRRALAESWDVFVYNPVTKKELRVVAATPHPEFDAAVAEFQNAESEFNSLREQLEALQKPPEEPGKKDGAGGAAPKKDKGEATPPPSEPATPPKVPTKEELLKIIQRLRDLEDRMLQAKELEIHFDVGVLDVDGTLPATIPLAPAGELPVMSSSLRLLGVPGDPKSPEVIRSELTSTTEAAGRYKERPPLIKAKGVTNQSLVLRNAADESGAKNWSGGALLDVSGRLTAVFSRPTPPLNAGESPSGMSGEIVPAARWTSLLSGSP